MNKLIIFLFAIVAFAGVALADELDKNFKDFLEEFEKDYSNLSKEEVHRRQKNFRDNIKMIKEHNKDPAKKFKLGVNEFTDYDANEFVGKMCGTVKPTESQDTPTKRSFLNASPRLSSVDWSPYCKPVVNQSRCGACWAFAAVGVVECYNSIQGNTIPKLSEQNVIDCDTDNYGCSGGWPTKALDNIQIKFGNKLASNAAYPYTGVKKNCQQSQTKYNCSIKSVFEDFFGGNESEMINSVSAYGPVAVAVKVMNNGLFQQYEGGVFYDIDCPVLSSTIKQCFNVNHAMVLVGYGETEEGEKYWKLRNSWGPKWGEGGYMKISRGDHNICNTACFAMGVQKFSWFE